MRALIAAIVALFGMLSYCGGTSDNPITGEKQRVRITPEQEVALGHGVGRVLARHSAEHLAKEQLTQQLIGAIAIGSNSYDTAQLAQLAGSLVNMKHSRDDELESDTLGLRLMREAGYDPPAMLSVMQKLEKASGGSRLPEFASTHPSPTNRIARIREQLGKPQ